MADALIGPLVGRLQELALSQARALVAVNKDIRRLRDKLMFLQAFLREADAKRHLFSDEITRVWLQQTRDAVFDAEDAVDHYYLQVDMSRYPWWARPSMRYVATFTTQVSMRHKLSAKVKDINSRLEDIIENKDKYRMEDTNKKSELTWKASTSISYAHRKLDDLVPPHIPIHDDNRKKLENAILPPTEEEDEYHHHPVLISVVGKSGVGKTTLVRDVYDKIDKKIFIVHAMESFAPYLTATNIQRQIVQKLREGGNNFTRSDVNKAFDEKIRGQKYLLVIDGEVSSTDWKDILLSLKVGAKGSRIVHITPHKPEEPPIGYLHVIINLESLGQETAVQLFHKRLIHIEVQDGISHDRHQDIHNITEGLPLGIALLSGLLQTKEFPCEWTNVFDYLKSKQSKRIHRILSVCFDDLPHELKCCFLYFAALPANIKIEARILVCLWMAEGFLRPRGGKTMEKVGYIYLNELIARNLVKPVHMDEEDKSSVGSIFVTIQNKVHEFLQFEAQEASFVEVHSGDDIPTLTSARRLSLQNSTDKYAVLASSLPKLRSIFSHFEQDPKDPREDQTYLCCSPQLRKISKWKRNKDIKSHIQGLLHRSEFLRVINLQGIEIGKRLPDEIGNVVHVQYLGITSCSLEEIPGSIGSLTSLQTLDVRETSVRELPLSFWTIKTLRHVFGGFLKFPKRIGRLKHLQTLDSVQLDTLDQDLVGTLGEMIHLEYLRVGNSSGGNVVALSKALDKLENLRTLIIKGENIPSSLFTSYTHRRLKFIVLDGKLDLPSNLNGGFFLPNLITLSLASTSISQEFIDRLAQLPFLATFSLYSNSYKDDNIAFSPDGFRCLKKLMIDVEKIKRFEANNALPKLEELDIHSQYIEYYHVFKENVDHKKTIVVDLMKIL
ncbi:putative disease resistance RPP13-like protein 2 [Aegilops tauschii subsp. strangulata]|nr:putative disease resistance RPP13-like protein 2 [Aegilops tauschii subsp. strangulata]